MILECILEEKRSIIVAERKRKAAEEQRKRLIEQTKKKAEQAKLAAKKGKDDAAEEAKEEDEEMKEEPQVEEDIVVELTDEEKSFRFRKSATPDIVESVLSKCYTDFSLPSTEEGFDEVKFEWQSASECSTFLKEWAFAKKLTQRVDDIQVGEWFKTELAQWTKGLQEWKKLAAEWKEPSKRKALLAKRAEAKKKEAAEKGDEEPQEEPEMDVAELDVLAVGDVLDIGNGQPLFSDFEFEDWVLLGARFEVHVLLHAFKKDVNDSDRSGFTEKDFAFYFSRYFKKALILKSFGLDTMVGFVDLIKDAVSMEEKTSFFRPVLDDDTPITTFVKLAELHRRERVRRLDAGDETAELKFPRTGVAPLQKPNVAASSSSWGGVRPNAGVIFKQTPRPQQQLTPRPAFSASLAPKRPFAPMPGAFLVPNAKQPRTAVGPGGITYGGKR